MNIIKTSKEFSKQDIYRMTHNRSVSLKDAVGKNLTVEDWLQYEDTNSRGENVTVLVLATEIGLCSTISGTFADAFLDIADAFPLPVKVNVIGGQTKSGRDFITCELA